MKKLPFTGHVRGFALSLALFSTCVASAATTTNLVFTTQPVSTTVGATLTNVVVQIRDSRGTNISQAGTAIVLVLSKGTGLTGITNVTTDASGKAVFTNLAIGQIVTADVFQASSKNFTTVTSSAFNITQGKTTNVLTASANPVVYGQPVTLTSIISVVAPSSGLLTGTVTFKDGGVVLGTSPLNASAQASFTTTNRLLAGTHNFTAVFSGNTNFAASTSVALQVAISKLALTVSGITASNKVYDARTTATLNVSNATLVGILSGDNVTLNISLAKGAFADKYAGAGKIVNITGLTIAGTNVANYSLIQPVTQASITTASLTVTARGVNKVYDSTTNATVVLADNRFAGDVFTDSYGAAVFTNKNIGAARPVFVSGIFISGIDATNYVLVNATASATANITAAGLTVSGITASNKVYDAKTTAGLNLTGATLIGAVGGDVLTLVTTNAKGVFANKNIGTAKPVTISGLAVSGTNAGNYTLSQPPATSANITVASLTVTAKGVNKVYDGSPVATVTLTDSHLAGDVVTDSYVSAAFTNNSVGTLKPVIVSGITVTGTDSTNYLLLNTNATTTANITAAKLLVSADSLSRPYGVTNPPLTFSFTGFVGGDTVSTGTTGNPVLATTAKTNSVPGTYPITITKGTLAAANYTLAFSNGVLVINPANTAALVSSGLNPARTNQSIAFVTKVSAMNPGVPAPTGLVRFKSNGNVIGSPVSLTNGTSTLIVPAVSLGSGSVIVTAEFADPSGNFNASTNSLSQTIVVVTPTIGKVSIAPPKFDGTVQAVLSGTPGQTFVLEASSDLIHWTPVCTNVADTNGLVSLVESNAMAYPSRYYRGVMP